jgi:hypothetical protein
VPVVHKKTKSVEKYDKKTKKGARGEQWKA